MAPTQKRSHPLPEPSEDKAAARAEALVAAFLAKGDRVTKPTPAQEAQAAKARMDLAKADRVARADAASFAR